MTPFKSHERNGTRFIMMLLLVMGMTSYSCFILYPTTLYTSNNAILPHRSRNDASDGRTALGHSIILNTPRLSMMFPSATSKGQVPKIVHQTWKSTLLPSPYREWRDECIKLNPGWDFKLWTDEDNRELVKLHYPFFISVYDSYDLNIKRIDAARYFMLHRFGGVYMDLDMTCLQPFGKAFDQPYTFYAAEQFSRKSNLRLFRNRHLTRVANAFMATPANHSVLTTILVELPAAAKERHVLKATGPRFLTTIINRNSNNSNVLILPLEKVFGQNWEDANKKSGCTNSTSCRAMNPDGITVSFWAHSWMKPGKEEPVLT